jgi:hypothetical protein
MRRHYGVRNASLAIFGQAIQWNLNKVARHKCLPLARIDVAKSRPGHGDELTVRIERVDRIFRIQDPARRHILVVYLFGAQAVGSDVNPDFVHRGTFDDAIASDAKEGKFHGGTFPIWRYAQLKTGSVPFLFSPSAVLAKAMEAAAPRKPPMLVRQTFESRSSLALMLGRMIRMFTGFGATASTTALMSAGVDTLGGSAPASAYARH